MVTQTQHHDWLSLVEISGPFLAVPVLKEAFPQGLEELDGGKRKRLRQAYDEWRDALETDDPRFADLRGTAPLAERLGPPGAVDLGWLDELSTWMPALRRSPELEHLGVTWLGEAESAGGGGERAFLGGDEKGPRAVPVEGDCAPIHANMHIRSTQPVNFLEIQVGLV